MVPFDVDIIIGCVDAKSLNQPLIHIDELVSQRCCVVHEYFESDRGSINLHSCFLLVVVTLLFGTFLMTAANIFLFFFILIFLLNRDQRPKLCIKLENLPPREIVFLSYFFNFLMRQATVSFHFLSKYTLHCIFLLLFIKNSVVQLLHSLYHINPFLACLQGIHWFLEFSCSCHQILINLWCNLFGIKSTALFEVLLLNLIYKHSYILIILELLSILNLHLFHDSLLTVSWWLTHSSCLPCCWL